VDSPSPAPNNLEQFRARTKRLEIHPLEVALLWIVGVHLVFLPWAIGGMRPWSQWISFALSLIGFVVALWPRAYTPEQTGTTSFRLIPWPKLVRFPIFWLGLALLALVVEHALNPAWEFQTDGRLIWTRPIAHLKWLPSSVHVPFKWWGPWRMLLIYSSAWLTVCSVWIGFTRRRTLQRLFTLLAANGVALAAFGIAERILRAPKILWVYESENASFFSTFVYKNHAGAYLLLTLGAACGIAAWHYLRGVRRLEKSNPSGVFAFMATCIAVSVLISYARGATFTMMAYLCVVVAGFVIHQIRLPKETRQPIIAIALVLLFGYFLKTGMDALHSDLAWDRLREAMSGQDVSVEMRKHANVASLAMLRQNWFFGTGSGSFQFLFPIYQQHVPEIAKAQFWQHAHNDILEIPIELGLPGVLLIVAAFGYWTITLLRNYVWQNPLSASVLLAAVFLIGLSWGEFVFQNPAILITWCALWPACTLWTILEEQRARP
jgi:O-antigen ligase